MYSTTMCVILVCAFIGIKRSDKQLFLASIIMFVSMFATASWEEGFSGFLHQAVMIDSIFAILFMMLSNVVYGTVMCFLLACNALLGIFSYSQFLNGGGYFYSEYESINGMITFTQALALLVIGGMREQRIGGILERFYDVRLSFSASVRFFLRVCQRNQKA